MSKGSDRGSIIFDGGGTAHCATATPHTGLHIPVNWTDSIIKYFLQQSVISCHLPEAIAPTNMFGHLQASIADFFSDRVY